MNNLENEEKDSDSDEICSIPCNMTKLFTFNNSKNQLISNFNENKEFPNQNDNSSVCSFNLSIDKDEDLHIQQNKNELIKLQPLRVSQNCFFISKSIEANNEKISVKKDSILFSNENLIQLNRINKIKIELFFTKIKAIINKYIALKIRDFLSKLYNQKQIKFAVNSKKQNNSYINNHDLINQKRNDIIRNNQRSGSVNELIKNALSKPNITLPNNGKNFYSLKEIQKSYLI